ncbi:cuticle protein CP14.6 [Nasonia vitripennis]|uniref:Uncharacterized protein n=1 Tax=Nasonia vitripennis TaxID=7425 RepID=A0A7M7GAX5_NASVI|nr:cuticle protein CP14.6 [Nasonia vitripennis]
MSRLVLVVLAVALAVASSAPTDSSSPVPILRQALDGPNPDGSYNYNYETGDGTKAEESGSLRNVGSENEAIAAQGSYSYTDPEGNVIEVKYIADENGFQPQGAHLPVAPAIPEAIQRALDWIAAHPQPVEEEKNN